MSMAESKPEPLVIAVKCHCSELSHAEMYHVELVRYHQGDPPSARGATEIFKFSEEKK